MSRLPKPTDYGHVWFNPKTQTVFFSLGDWEEREAYDAWTKELKNVKGVKDVMGEAESSPPQSKGPWLRVKQASLSTVLSPVAQAAGWQRGPVTDFLGSNGSATPFSATLAGGALAAGLGYGAGALAEQFLPEEYFEKGKLRRNAALFGGLAGAAPGFWSGTVNYRQGSSIFDPIGSQKQAQDLKYLNDMLDVFINPDPCTKREMDKLAAAFDGGGFGPRPIEKDRFNRALWEDPFTPPAIKGMAAGLAEASTAVAGNDEWFRPVDTATLGASIAANSAAGWAAGAVAGKVMGALTGLSDPGQRALQQAGIFGGLISAVVPRVFGTGSGRSSYEYYS